jgi:hypothetical protein
MRRSGRPTICEPVAIAGEIAAARARSRYAAPHIYGYGGITGSIRRRTSSYRATAPEDDERLPLAVPGND